MSFVKNSVLVAGLVLAGTIALGIGASAQAEPEAEEPEKSPQQWEEELAEQERIKAEQAKARTPEALAPRLKQMEEIAAKLKIEREQRQQQQQQQQAQAKPPAPPDTRPEEERLIEEGEKVLRVNEKLVFSNDDQTPEWYKARAAYGVTNGRETIGNARRVKLQKLWGPVLNKPEAVAELKEHGRRMALLRRIQMVAEVKRYPKTVTRAARLIEREEKRHQSAMEQLRDADKPAEPETNKPAEPGVAQ
jgi:hypothetical protein